MTTCLMKCQVEHMARPLLTPLDSLQLNMLSEIETRRICRKKTRVMNEYDKNEGPVLMNSTDTRTFY